MSFKQQPCTQALQGKCSCKSRYFLCSPRSYVDLPRFSSSACRRVNTGPKVRKVGGHVTLPPLPDSSLASLSSFDRAKSCHVPRTEDHAPNYKYRALHFPGALPSLKTQVEDVSLSSWAPAKALPGTERGNIRFLTEKGVCGHAI